MQNYILLILIYIVPLGQLIFLNLNNTPQHSIAVWAKNAPIAVLAILLLPFSDLNLKRTYVKFSLLFFIIVVLSTTQVNEFKLFYPNDFLLFVTTFFIFNTDFKIKISHIKIYSFLLTIVFLITSYSFKGALGYDTYFDPLAGFSTWENHFMTYALGLLSLFFLFQKEYLFFIILVTVFLFGMKRFALASAIVLGTAFFLTGSFFDKKRNRAFLEIAVVILIILMSFFVTEIFSFFDFDIKFSSSRDEIFGFIIEKIKNDIPFSKLFLGNGPGYNIYLMEASQTHNEFFRFFIDYGLLGICIFLYIFRELYSLSKKTFFLGIYTLLCGITDKVLTHTVYLITFLLIHRYLEGIESERMLVEGGGTANE